MHLADFETGNSVAIEHFHCRYLVPREHPAPETLASDLDRMVRTSLADSCARSLDYALDPRDPSVWVIRRLEFTLSLDSGYAQADRIGAAWGAHFAQAIVRTILGGPDGETVLRFPDRAAFLSAFLRDLVRGRAFDLWPYRSFDSLRSLPQGAAAREALVREPELIPAVLAALDAQSFEGLLGILSAGDVLRVIESAASAAGTSADGERQSAQLLLEAWRAVALRPTGDNYVTPHNLLRLLVRAAGKDSPWTERLVTVAGHLLSLCHLLRRMAYPQRLLSALAAGDVRTAAAEAVSQAGSRYVESLPFLKDLSGGDHAWLTAIAETIAGPVATLENESAAATHYLTPFGGLLLLLPIMAGAETMELVSESGVDPGLGALVLLMKCAGRDRALAVFDDPLYRRLTGVSPTCPARDLAESLPLLACAPLEDDTYFTFETSAVDRSWSAAASSVLRRFARRFTGFERSRPERLYENFLDIPASASFSSAGMEARLGRPPLAILLHMTGYDSLTVRLPWLEDFEVTVTLDEA